MRGKMKKHIRPGISTFIAITALGIAIYLLGFYPFKEINLERKIEKASTGECIDLAKLNKVSWDSVYVLKPYQTIDEVNIKVPKKYKKRLNDNSMLEGCSTLIFTKNNKLVNYAEIADIKIDFVGIDKPAYDKASAKLIVQK